MDAYFKAGQHSYFSHMQQAGAAAAYQGQLNHGASKQFGAKPIVSFVQK